MVLACACSAPAPAPPVKPPPVAPVPTEEVPEQVRIYPAISVRKAGTKYTLEVLGVELVGKVNPVATMASVNLTNWLRKIADDDLFITVGRKNLELLDAKLLAGCDDNETACMQKIAKAVDTDRVLFGIVNDFGGEFYVHLTMLDASTGRTVKWTGNTFATSRDAEYTAKVALDALIRQMP
jgi:hypothetical protein